MIYIFAFFASILCFYLGIKAKEKILRCTGVILAVLILALLAGCRDYTVGTDVGVYGIHAFNKVLQFPSLYDLLIHYNMEIEPGFAVIAYLSSRISDSPHLFFFIVALIIYGLIAKAIYDNRDESSPITAWTLYLFLFFSDSLNIMRQSIALAIVFYGFQFVKRKEYGKAVITVLAGMFFHTSAVIALAVYGMFYYKRNKKTANINRLMIFALGAAFITLIFPPMFAILVRSGILPEFYSRYLDGGSIGIAVKPMLVRVAPIALIWIFWNKYRKVENAEFYITIIITEMIVYNLTTVTPTFERISLYFGFYRIFAYSILTMPAVTRRRRNRYMLTGFLVCYALLMFVYQVIIMGGNQVYPYTSAILGL